LRLLLVFRFTFFWLCGFAQQADCFEDEFIIQLSKGSSIATFLSFNPSSLELEWDRCLHHGSNIHLIRTNTTASSNAILAILKRNNAVQIAMQNCRTSSRGLVPNDPLFEEQWGIEKIQATDLWELGVGTPNGDSIVVAILDEGFDVVHEDLSENIWKNHEEIPGDEIDNDGNGYTDDYRGLNLLTQNDEHPSSIAASSHGTSVAGIIGARENNEIGTAGVAWGQMELKVHL